MFSLRKRKENSFEIHVHVIVFAIFTSIHRSNVLQFITQAYKNVWINLCLKFRHYEFNELGKL